MKDDEYNDQDFEEIPFGNMTPSPEEMANAMGMPDEYEVDEESALFEAPPEVPNEERKRQEENRGTTSTFETQDIRQDEGKTIEDNVVDEENPVLDAGSHDGGQEEREGNQQPDDAVSTDQGQQESGTDENPETENKNIWGRIKEKASKIDWKQVGAGFSAVVVAILCKLHEFAVGFLFGKTDIPAEYLKAFNDEIKADGITDKGSKGKNGKEIDEEEKKGRGNTDPETEKKKERDGTDKGKENKVKEAKIMSDHLHEKGYYLVNDPQLEGTGILKLSRANQQGDKSCYIRESELKGLSSEEGKRNLSESLIKASSIASAERYLEKAGIHIIAVGDNRFIAGKENGPSFSFDNDLITDKKLRTVVKQFNALERKQPGHEEPVTEDMEKPLTKFTIKEAAEEIKAERIGQISAVRQSINGLQVPDTGLAMAADMNSDAVYVYGLGESGIEEGKAWIVSQSALAKGEATELAKIIFEHDNPDLANAGESSNGTMPGIVGREIDAAVKAMRAVSAMRDRVLDNPSIPCATADILTNNGTERIEMYLSKAGEAFRYNGSEVSTSDPDVFKELAGKNGDNISLIAQYMKEYTDPASGAIGKVAVQAIYGDGQETQEMDIVQADSADSNRDEEEQIDNNEYDQDQDNPDFTDDTPCQTDTFDDFEMDAFGDR